MDNENNKVNWNLGNLDLGKANAPAWNFDNLDMSENNSTAWNFDGLDLQNLNESAAGIINEPEPKRTRSDSSQGAMEVDYPDFIGSDDDYYDSQSSSEDGTVQPGTSASSSNQMSYSNQNFEVEVKKALFKRDTRFNYSDIQYHVKFKSKANQNHVLLRDALEGLIQSVYKILKNLRAKIKGNKDRILYLVSI